MNSERENCKLVEISAELKNDFCELAAEGIAAKETPYINWDGDFEDYLRRMQILSKGENLPDNDVPSHTYLLICGEKVFGRCEIRRKLNAEFEIYGHISADIRPSERKKGFGALTLKLALIKAKELELERVLITCKKENIASAKIIEKCGGVFEKQFVDEETKKIFCRYWIEL
jgi:predicted acetyltransferase